MSSSLDQKTGVNALLCYIVLGYAEKIKQCFIKIMSLPSNQVGKEEGNFTSERNNFKGGGRCCELLEDDILRRSKADEQVVITESLLVASLSGEENWSEGYRWVHSQIKVTHESLANQI